MSSPGFGAGTGAGFAPPLGFTPGFSETGGATGLADMIGLKGCGLLCGGAGGVGLPKGAGGGFFHPLSLPPTGLLGGGGLVDC